MSNQKDENEGALRRWRGRAPWCICGMCEEDETMGGTRDEGAEVE